MKKLRERRGETLIESLVSLLVITLTFAFLTTTAITAAKLNAKVRQADTSFRYEDAEKQGRRTVQAKSLTRSGSASVQMWTENGYSYYEYEQGGTS